MKKSLLLSMMLAFGLIAWAQERSVTGSVRSESDGSALPGVNVVLKGTTTGAVTDASGSYTLTVPASGGTLVFSFIGFLSREMDIGDRTTINVQLSEDTRQLSEVVVTGYGIERAANEVTYQTGKVNAQELVKGQQQVLAAGLVGKVAGLQVNVTDNGVNPQTQILLRGLRSISKDNEALIVIDGAISSLGAFNDLNPQDVENIYFMKSANAAATYGSDGVNGAVIVSTKKGQLGQAFRVGVNTSMTFEEVAYMPNFQTEHGTGWGGTYDPIENTNWGPRFDGVPRIIGPDFPDDWPVPDQIVPYAPIKDNLKDFYDVGSTLQNTFYASGGDETSTFYMSYGRTNTKGIVPFDTYDRNTFRVNASKRIGKLRFGVNSSYFEDNTDVVAGRIGDQERPLYWFILNTSANIPLSTYADWDNPLSYGYANNYQNAYYQNPYWGVGTNRDVDQSSRLIANINGAYEITDRIDLSGRLGVNRYAQQGKEHRDAQTYDPVSEPYHSPVSSYVQDYEDQYLQVNGNVALSGDFDLSSDFSLKPILSAAFTSTEDRSSTITGNNLSIPGFYDISNATGQLVGSVNQSAKRTFGVFADLTLGYKDWAFLNVAGRQDYTSTLPQDNNSYFYPMVGLGVVLSNAMPSIANSGVLSFAKVTVSNSTVYNDLPVYALNERFSQPTYFPMGSINGFEQSNTTVDANIQKEKLNTLEFGVNLGFLNDRFTLDGAFYNTKTSDLITYTTPSYASGASSFLTNIGQLSETGYEVSIGGTVLNIGDFKWVANVNYTHFETIVDEIKEDLKEVAVANYGTYGTYAIVGMAFPQIKAQSYVRDPQGRVVVDAGTGNPLIGEVLPQGKTTPDHIIGAVSELSFKGISLSATIDYRTGFVYYAQGQDAMEFTGRSLESVSSDRQDFVWPNSSIKNSDGTYSANPNIPISNGLMGFWQNTYNEIKENYVKDATAFKIREVALNYTLPESLISSTGFLHKATVGFVARNLWTNLAKQNRFSDPEFRNSTSTDNNIGVGGYFQSPPTRSFGFLVNVEL